VTMKNFDRTDKNPVFLNTKAKSVIKKASKKLLFIVESNGMDVSMNYEDAEGEMYILWCEHCIHNKDQSEECVIAKFELKSEWFRKKFIKKYYSQIEGRTDRPGPAPFDPNFYQLTEMYRSGYTINDLAEHYQVNERTIRRYMEENFVTKVPIDPAAYLDSHEKVHGRDEAYWNIRRELIEKFDLN